MVLYPGKQGETPGTWHARMLLGTWRDARRVPHPARASLISSSPTSFPQPSAPAAMSTVARGLVGDMKIHRAVNNGDLDAIVKAVEDGADVNEVRCALAAPFRARAPPRARTPPALPPLTPRRRTGRGGTCDGRGCLGCAAPRGTHTSRRGPRAALAACVCVLGWLREGGGEGAPQIPPLFLFRKCVTSSC